MDTLNSFSVKHPILFVLIFIVLWWIVMMLVSGITAGVLHKPYDNAASAMLGRVFVIICGILLIWKLDWLAAARITRLGSSRIWLATLGGMICYTCASLYAFYGEASFDISVLAGSREAGSILLIQSLVAVNEEVLFRGIVLYIFTRAWGKTACGQIGSVLLTSLLFAVLHATQIFTDNLDPSAAWYLVLGTFFLSIWWGTLALAGGSIWSSVLLHFAGNTAVMLQGLSTPSLESGSLVYERLMWFSLIVGALGMGVLVIGKSIKTGQVLISQNRFN